MKKILFITDNFPYPPDKDGNSENIYNIIRHLKILKSEFQIDLLFVGKLKSITQYQKDQLKKYVSHIFYKNLNHHYLIRFSRFLLTKFNISDEYNIYFFSNFHSGYLKNNLPQNVPSILYQADSVTLHVSKKKGTRNKIKYIQYKIEQKRLFKSFDKVIFVSKEDRYEVNTYAPYKNKYLVIPIGFDKKYKKKDENLRKIYDLVFSGNFGFYPNSEAAMFIINEITPELIKKYPNITIGLIGRNPTNKMIKCAKKYKKNIIITGEVPSIPDELNKGRIFISPLKTGSGMKNKILQAIAVKLPIIASNESFTGFNNHHFIIANNINEWIININKLLKDENQQIILSKKNYLSFIEEYLWKSIINKYYLELFN